MRSLHIGNHTLHDNISALLCITIGQPPQHKTIPIPTMVCDHPFKSWSGAYPPFCTEGVRSVAIPVSAAGQLGAEGVQDGDEISRNC